MLRGKELPEDEDEASIRREEEAA